MYNVSEAYKQAVQQSAREWDIYMDITLSNGTQLRLDKDDLGMGSVVLKEGATCSETLQVGSVFCNSLKFSITNDTKQHDSHDFYGAKVEPYVGLMVSESFNYIPLGVFNILEPVKKLSTIPVVCFDNMSLTGKIFDFSKIKFPATCKTIFDEVLRQCGIKAAISLSNEIAGLKYEINSLLTNNPKCRDILAGFGIMLSKNLRFNRKGLLESFWYSDFGKVSTPDTRVNNSEYSDQVIKVTGVYLSDTYGNVFSVGTADYPIELPDSPIIQGEEMSLEVLNSALTKFKQLSYRAAKIDYIGDPAVQAGDIIEHRDTAVGSIKLPVMRLIYKLAGTSTIESLGSSEASQNQQTASDRKVDKAFSKVDETRKVLESSIKQTAESITTSVSQTYETKENATATKQELASSITQTANKITTSVSETYETKEAAKATKEALESSITQTSKNITTSVSETYETKADATATKSKVDENTKAITENKTKIEQTAESITSEVTSLKEQNDDLSKRVTNVEQTSDNLTISIQKINSEGITTSKGYKFGDDGMLISESGSSISNRIDNTGSVVERIDGSGNPVATITRADTSGFFGLNVNAEQYITVGGVARLEQYTRGTDRRRVALYILGE